MLIMTNLEYTQRRIRELTDTSEQYFGRALEITDLHFDDINAPHEALISILSDKQGYTYALVVAGSRPQPYRDLRKYLKSAGLEVLKMYPPHNDQEYFVRRGREIFLQAYPGRTHWTELEKNYYTSLAPCQAAMAKIDPHFRELYRFNEIAGRWQRSYDQQDIEAVLMPQLSYGYQQGSLA
ncbi:hypothetical protein RAAC3_TM7C00001G0072 [Candidatus Saccharibacteria bacterium RAAC3_TM7_1]|nr:hypothetical protein RAAC3_TM7C00001G0072 [Candidatus Saccharibacteria bacterium RAAC3_TM7_1]HCZ28203.1 hypothetical protein [Candidatus Saccharibacteria bacterium]